MTPPYRIVHEDLTCYVYRVAADQRDRSLNDLLFESDRLSVDQRITFGFQSAVVRRADDVILLDAGLDAVATTDELSQIGLHPADIDIVLISHQDFDHVGGLVTSAEELTFPAAQHVLPESLWTSMGDERFLAALPESDAACLRTLRRRLAHPLRPSRDGFVLPGIEILFTPGHRKGGHAAYEISTESAPLLYVADAILHPAFVDVHSGPFLGDEQPDAGAASRRRLIERAVATSALVFSAHAPYPGLGRIGRQARGVRWTSSIPPNASA